MPKDEEGKSGFERMALVLWFIQTNAYPEKALLGIVDKGLGEEGWKDFPGTVLVHGDKDVVVPYELSVELSKVIGELLHSFSVTEASREEARPHWI